MSSHFSAKPLASRKTLVAIAAVFLGLPICMYLSPFIKSYYEARTVFGVGMQPTLQPQDHVLVNKTRYIYDKLTRGDIVLFDPTSTMKKQAFQGVFLKRIVGLPGETFRYQNEQVYINRKMLQESYIVRNEQLRTHACKTQTERMFSRDIMVPSDSYVVLGDNRDESYDSRCWGFIPKAVILGKAESIFLPFNRIRRVDQLK
jgi:signal peptidase I